MMIWCMITNKLFFVYSQMGDYVDDLLNLPGKIGKVNDIMKVLGVKGSSFVLKNLHVPRAPAFAPMDGMHFMENMGKLYTEHVWPRILTKKARNRIDDLLERSIVLPSHWGRKPRSLFNGKPGKWKAEEWHNFILHLSLIVFEGELPPQHYKGVCIIFVPTFCHNNVILMLTFCHNNVILMSLN